MSALARLKRGVRAAIAACGGIDGAAATIAKSRSLVGSWHNCNQQDMPTLGDALAIDEIAVIDGQAPAILNAYAAELGHVAIRLPDPGMGDDAVTAAMIDASAEFGDIATRLRDATADNHFDVNEREAVATEIDQAQAALARMKALVLAQGAPRAVPVREVN